MREKILDAAQSLVEERGLNAVSFQDLANAVGLKKPSLFHHFQNKDALAMALLERCRTSYGERYAKVLDRDISAPKKLYEIARLFEEGLKKQQLCLLGALGGDCATLSTELASELRKTTEMSVVRYAAVFEQGRAEGSLEFEGQPKDVAFAFLAMLQGMQVLSRAKQDESAFGPAAAGFIGSIQAGA
ncbi:MAG: TetR/AcrR family transcriptional regulator [Verrucomicrobiota bacterium]